jgi:hypothetical protein
MVPTHFFEQSRQKKKAMHDLPATESWFQQLTLEFSPERDAA